MHELSLVTELVRRCGELAGGRPVAEVYVHCAEGTETEEVAEAFAFLAAHAGPQASPQGSPQAGPQGSPQTSPGIIGGARLNLSTVPARGACRCGFSGELRAEALAGHMFVCPRCGCVGEQGPALELVGMTFRDG